MSAPADLATRLRAAGYTVTLSGRFLHVGIKTFGTFAADNLDDYRALRSRALEAGAVTVRGHRDSFGRVDLVTVKFAPVGGAR